MPPEHRVGRDDRGDLTRAPTAQPVPVHGQPPPFVIGQADPATQLRAEDAIFFDQIGDRSCRWSAHQPATAITKSRTAATSTTAGVYTHRLNVAPGTASAEKWDTTGSISVFSSAFSSFSSSTDSRCLPSAAAQTHLFCCRRQRPAARLCSRPSRPPAYPHRNRRRSNAARIQLVHRACA